MSTPPDDHTDPCADEALEPQQCAGSNGHSVDNNAALQSAYAAANTYAQPAVESCSCTNQEPATEGSPGQRGGTAYVHSESRHYQERSCADPIEVARDARRLAASVRWVEREEIAARLRLAGLMPSVSPFAPLDVRGDANIDNGSSSRLRETDSGMLPSAMRVRRDPLHTSFVVLTVSTSVLLASIFTSAYYVSRFPPGSQIGSLDSRVATQPRRSSSTQRTSERIIARDDDPGMLSNGEIFHERFQSWAATKSIAPAAVATVPPGTSGIQEPSLSTTVNPVDSTEDNAFLLKQGLQFIAAGDVLAARNSFRQAAEAGHRDAAIALGATYDPTLLAALGVVGIDADDTKARSWYERAEKLGSPNAKLWLDSHGGR
jgi:hypothetical protein